MNQRNGYTGVVSPWPTQQSQIVSTPQIELAGSRAIAYSVRTRKRSASFWRGSPTYHERRRLPPSNIIDEQNCLACHARDTARGLAESLPALVEHHKDLVTLVPAMTPPSLDQVGDKLHRAALAAAIQRKTVHRDYLAVRMPSFQLTARQQQQIVDYLVGTDRIPDEAVSGSVAGASRSRSRGSRQATRYVRWVWLYQLPPNRIGTTREGAAQRTWTDPVAVWRANSPAVVRPFR